MTEIPTYHLCVLERWRPPQIPHDLLLQFYNVGKAWVHRSSVVDKGATLGEGTVVWHFAHIASTAVIGKNCMLGQGCFIAGHVGQGSKIQNNVSVWQEVTLAKECFVGPGVQFTNAHIPNPGYRSTAVPTTIGERCAICAGAVIVAPCTIDSGSFVAAGAVVRSSIYSPGSVLVGCPATHNAKVMESVIRNRGRNRKVRR